MSTYARSIATPFKIINTVEHQTAVLIGMKSPGAVSREKSTMSEPGRIRVMIVDDHEMVRSGLAVFLETFDDLELVGDAADGREAVRTCTELQPDVVLMDLRMPQMDGVEATRRVLEVCPTIQVIALTSFKEEELIHRALQAGAIGYLLKNISIDELADAIRKAYNGKATLSPEATQILVQSATRAPTPGHNLTQREREVLILMVMGLSNREIAEKLIISHSTVKNHISSILIKLDVTNRSEAVALAVQHNLFT
jgi:two-component system, NarL family, response regulator LiaR